MLGFGSRSGSYVALAFFGLVFAGFGGVVAHMLTRCALRRRTAAGGGVLFGAALLALLYASSLAGFYEVEVRGPEVSLHYLLSLAPEVIPLESISGVRAVAAYRGRWRLELSGAGGRRFESTVASAHDVKRALDALDRARGAAAPPR